MALTRFDINRGYKDPRWGGYGYLKAREDATSPSRRSAADSALLRMANRRRWTYDTLFEEVLNSQAGRIYGEYANDQFRSDSALDGVLGGLEVYQGLTPGARSAFDPGNANVSRYNTDNYGRAAEERFERNRQLEKEVAEVAKRDADERRIDAMIKYGRPRARGFSLFSRSGRARYRKR